MENATATQEVKVESKAASQTVLLTGDVVVRGAELVPEKLLGFIDYILQQHDNGVSAIMFRADGQPLGKMGMATPLTGSCVVNLKHIFNRTCDLVESEGTFLNLQAALWLAVMDTTLHEIHHVAYAFTDPHEYDMYLSLEGEEKEKAHKALEKMCEEESAQMIVDAAKHIDIELPSVGEFGFFGVEMMKLFTDKELMKDAKWLRRGSRQIEQGIVYEDREEEVYLKSMREYVRTTIAPHVDKEESEDWEQPVSLINVRTEQEDGTVAVDKAQPVAEAQVPESAAAVQTTTPAALPAGDQKMIFVGAGMEADPVDDAPDAAIVSQYTDAGYDAYVPPEHIQQEMAKTAAAAAGPAPQEAPKQFDNPVHISPEQVAEILQSVYMRLYSHLFGKCGWSQNPTNGHFHFANPTAVLISVPISDLIEQKYPEAAGLLAEYETVSAQGQDGHLEPCQGYVRGFVYRNKNLPAYKLHFNIGGVRVVRTLVPQNPEKLNAQNAYSRPAQEAQIGHARAWIMDALLPYNAQWSEKCKAEIVNNQYMPKG